MLAHAAQRLRAHAPAVVEADVCKPLNLDGQFDTVAMNLVLHCLPAAYKASAVHHVACVLASPNGYCASSTAGGTFDNLNDTEVSLAQILAGEFASVDLRVQGSVLIFAPTGPPVRA